MTISDGRRLPFLDRNWRDTINDHWPLLGSKAQIHATPPHPHSSSEGAIQYHESNGFETRNGDAHRPSKRQRVEKDSPNHEEATVEPIIPTLEEFLNTQPVAGDPLRKLRIDVVSILHRDSARKIKSRISSDSADEPTALEEGTAPARCKITILDNSPSVEHAPQVVHCSSRKCQIRSFKDATGSVVSASVHLDQPFIIPEEEIWVNTEDDARGLAPRYRADVEISCVDSAKWPPVDVAPTEGSRVLNRRWTLLSCFCDIYHRSRSSAALYIHPYTREDMRLTSYNLRVDFQWSLGHRPLVSSPKKPYLQCATTNGICRNNSPARARANLSETTTLVNGEGSVANGSVRAISEEPDIEITPSRALRSRGNKQYNLKVLSDQAQGIGKKRKAVLCETDGLSGALLPPGDGKVLYQLSPEQVLLDSYRCMLCQERHQSLSTLRLHLENRHPQYAFDLTTTKNIPQFHVTHQLEWYTHQPPSELPAPRTSGVYKVDPAGHESVTALDSDGQPTDISDRGRSAGNAIPRRPKSETRKRILVPDVQPPLYDAASRAGLVPNTELISSTPDDSWWLQRHREAIADYIDLGSAEMEYLLAWDSRCLPSRISSDAYVPQIWANFVKDNASWIVASADRYQEFLKHLAYLQTRVALDEETIEEGCKRIEHALDAQHRRGPETQEATSSDETWHPKKNPSCHVCGLAISSVFLECSNPTCRRSFHETCLEDPPKGNKKVKQWVCDGCGDENAAARNSKAKLAIS